MFGKKKEVRLTDKQIQALMETMSPAERRKFLKDQKKLAKEHQRKLDDEFFDGLLIGSLFFDD